MAMVVGYVPTSQVVDAKTGVIKRYASWKCVMFVGTPSRKYDPLSFTEWCFMYDYELICSGEETPKPV